MNPHRSSILRIGLINSGMFDLLELNMDVRAIHLIAGNNVGKTSLIELIQFLYFHNIQEMTFSKPLSETQQFYFRREGSYILFEVRTINNAVRTVGIYGEGTADSRQIFVFDGAFKLTDFLDDQRCVLPLKQAQVNFFDRGFEIYRRFEDYERALIGNHTESTYNVQLFKLKTTKFRLLRRLLRGLLRLDRLTAREAQEFLIQIVEMDGTKTTINLEEAFESRYRDIRSTRLDLDDLRQLAPIIEKWRELTDRLREAQKKERQVAENYHHTYLRYLSYMEGQRIDVEALKRKLEEQKEKLDQRRTELIEQRVETKRHLESLESIVAEIERLQEACATLKHDQLKKEFNSLQLECLKLEEMLSSISADDVSKLERREHTLQLKQTQLMRQISARTIQDVWRDSEISEEAQVLLKYLLSEQLIALPEAVVDSAEMFLRFSRDVEQYIQPNGTFVGFGLKISRAEWFEPLFSGESLEEQLQHVQQQLANVQQQLEVARDREKKKADLQSIQFKMKRCRGRLDDFETLESLLQENQSLLAVKEKLQQLEQDINEIQASFTELDADLKNIDGQIQTHVTKISNINDAIRQLEGADIESFDTQCPMHIQLIPETDLAEEYRLGERRIGDTQRDIRKLREDIHEPEIELEKRYDRASPDQEFSDWLESKLEINNEIARLEMLLHEQYDTLITQIKGQFSNLTAAFEAVKNQLAGLNNAIRKVQISNIQQIQIDIEESEALKGIRSASDRAPQLGLFDARPMQSTAESENAVQDFLDDIRRQYGHEVSLATLFSLNFHIKFIDQDKIEIKSEIDRFESNGTRIGIKIVLFLGLIRLLLPENSRSVSTRIPFFLDEVGSLDSKNLRALIQYCEENNFLPIFASPEIREEIPHNYIFRRMGARSQLVEEVIITDLSEETIDAA